MGNSAQSKAYNIRHETKMLMKDISCNIHNLSISKSAPIFVKLYKRCCCDYFDAFDEGQPYLCSCCHHYDQHSERSDHNWARAKCNGTDYLPMQIFPPRWSK